MSKPISILVVNKNFGDYYTLRGKLESGIRDIRRLDSYKEISGLLVENKSLILIIDIRKAHEMIVLRFKELTEIADVPIVIVANKNQNNLNLQYIESGAADFITFPLSDELLIMKIKSIARRWYEYSYNPGTADFIKLQNLEICITNNRVWLSGVAIELTETEFKILLHLVKNKNVPISREALLSMLGKRYSVDPMTINAHIRRIRMKIETDPSRPKRIKSIWGIGYKYHISQ